MAILAAAFNVDLSQPQVEIYAADLADIPFEILSQAITSCRRELKFFPKIAEILERCNQRETKEELERGAFKAWDDVLAANYKYHPDSMPNGGIEGLSGRTRYALRIIGGHAAIFNNWNDSQLMSFLRRDFLAAWESDQDDIKHFALPPEKLRELMQAVKTLKQ